MTELLTPLTLEERIIEALKSIYDPEIPTNIYDLGLIYSLEVDETNRVQLQMTLTSPGCPVAQTFPQTVQEKILQVPGVTHAAVELVWEPAWTKERMSEVAKVQLDMW